MLGRQGLEGRACCAALLISLQPHPPPPPAPRCVRRAKTTLITRHESDLKDNVYWMGLLTHLQNPRVPHKSAPCLRDLKVSAAGGHVYVCIGGGGGGGGGGVSGPRLLKALAAPSFPTFPHPYLPPPPPTPHNLPPAYRPSTTRSRWRTSTTRTRTSSCATTSSSPASAPAVRLCHGARCSGARPAVGAPSRRLSTPAHPNCDTRPPTTRPYSPCPRAQARWRRPCRTRCCGRCPTCCPTRRGPKRATAARARGGQPTG